MKLLIAESNPEVVEPLQALLGKHEHKVHCAADGEEALRLFQQHDPEGIFSALTLPKLGGMELLQEVRNSSQCIPFVMICPVSDPEKILDALKLGACDFLVKPLNELEMQRTLDRVASLHQGFRFSAYVMDHLIQESRTLEIGNDFEGINRIVAFLTQDLASYGILPKEELFRVNTLLAEALENAIFHGNLELPVEMRRDQPKLFQETAEQKSRMEPFLKRKVIIHYEISRNSVKYIIRDEGPGFDHSRLPDPTDPQNLFQMKGRGLLLIMNFMDEVFWNERGSEITMIRYRKRKTAG